MKANRKFLKSDEDAVSPVIAVILMVAITVVLAATVYVWVSGFSGGQGGAAKSMALSGNGAIGAGGAKAYTVSSATPGMKWSDVSMSINGAAVNQTAAATDGEYTCPSNTELSTRFLVCGGTLTKRSNATISAGDIVKFTGVSSGQTLRIVDATGNSVILTMNIG